MKKREKMTICGKRRGGQQNLSLGLNENTKHYTKFGKCEHPDTGKVFFFFRPTCVLMDNVGGLCMLQEKFKRNPWAPPPPPRTRPPAPPLPAVKNIPPMPPVAPPKRIINEDIGSVPHPPIHPVPQPGRIINDGDLWTWSFPKRERSGRTVLDKDEVKKRTRCLNKHQPYWKNYSVGRPNEGRVRFVACSLCGCRHMLNDAITTEEDIERMKRDHG